AECNALFRKLDQLKAEGKDKTKGGEYDAVLRELQTKTKQRLGSTAKVAYVAHVPGHRNSKGEAAPWVIKQHNTDKILESFKSEGAAKEGLKNMESHKHGCVDKTAVDYNGKYLEKDDAPDAVREHIKKNVGGARQGEDALKDHNAAIDSEKWGVLGKKQASALRVGARKIAANIDKFTQAYIVAALWSSNDNSDPSGGEPLDSNYDIG